MADRHPPHWHRTPTRAPAGVARSQAEVVGPGHSFGSVTDKIASAILRPGFLPGWLVGFVLAFGVMSMFLFAVTWLLIKGTGHLGRQRAGRAGALPSSTSSGGSASATPAR